MAASQLRSITQPNYHRVGTNLSGTDIPKCRILKGGATADEIALASAVTDAFVGVSEEIIYNGKAQSYQNDGRTVIETGGSFSVNDQLTTDSIGRAIAATEAAGASQNVIGRAATASSGIGVFAEVELKQLGNLFSSVLSVADDTAVKAIAASARFTGMMVLQLDNNSLWRFDSTITVSDTSNEILKTPAAGTGRWVRLNKTFAMKLAIGFGTTDATALHTVPEGFLLKIMGQPWWEVTTAFTGGTNAAIGVSSAKSGYSTKGDFLGGSGGDVLASLSAGVKLGTAGAKLDTIAHYQAAVLVEGDIIRFDRIVDAFTAGAGFVRVPVLLASAPATP